MSNNIRKLFPGGQLLEAAEASSCPSCGEHQTMAATYDGPQTKPVVGDATVCFDCSALLKFGEGLKLELLTEEDKAGPYAGLLSDILKARDLVWRLRGLS